MEVFVLFERDRGYEDPDEFIILGVFSSVDKAKAHVKESVDWSISENKWVVWDTTELHSWSASSYEIIPTTYFSE